MGVGSSTANKLDKALASDLPEDERYFGLENDKNSRDGDKRNHGGGSLMPGNGTVKSSWKGVSSAMNIGATMGTAERQDAPTQGKGHEASGSGSDAGSDRRESGEETMLSALTDLFSSIAAQKKRTGSVPPKSFINRLRLENELFSSYMHQDAHEFLNFILNEVAEILQREEVEKIRRQKGLPPRPPGRVFSNSNLADMKSAPHENGETPLPKTFVHDLFEGELSNEVRCLCCETVTQRTESFLDLSVDIEQNSSLTSCLRNFSSTELLSQEDKFYCDACCTLQEAERRMRIKRLPKVLALHLKRFKFMEQIGKYKKLSYRVVFPLELRFFITSDDAEDPDRLYSLFAVVVHVGSGPNHGHYVSLIKSHGHWLLFDDDCVEPKDESEIQSVFGVTQDVAVSTEAGYILFYESVAE